MTGTDVILDSLLAMEETIVAKVDRTVAEELFLSIDVIKSCLRDIVNTNSFMLMSINRCIDYTKVSDGMKLKPRNETIDLADALSLPIVCMQNSQENSVISMGDIPSEICTHVITDKQWLQENVLCLLSNAVKYSTGGEVFVSISLDKGEDRNSSFYKLPARGLRKQSTSDLLQRRAWKMASCESTDEDAGSVITPRSSGRTDFLHHQSSTKTVDFSVLQAMSLDRAEEEELPPRKEMLRIEVRDNGIGVPEEKRCCLFHPFQQTQKLAGGTGLGLYSLAKRIEALGGSYGVNERTDGEKGSIFYFTIPYRPDEVTAENALTELASLQHQQQQELARRLLRESSSSASPPVTTPIAPRKISSYHERSSATQHNIEDHRLQHLVEIEDDLGKQSASNQSSNCSTPSSAARRHSSRGVQQILVNLPRLSIKPVDNRQTSTDDASSDSTITTSHVGSDRPHRNSFSGASGMATPQHYLKGHEKARILLVEDSQAIGKMTCALLNKSGYAVDWVVNGAIAIEWLGVSSTSTTEESIIAVAAAAAASSVRGVRAFPPVAYDVVLMDLQMPTMDGLEATKRLRAFEQQLQVDGRPRPRQLVIGLSANSDRETISATTEAGFDAFMEKPIKIDVLADLLATHVTFTHEVVGVVEDFMT